VRAKADLGPDCDVHGEPMYREELCGVGTRAKGRTRGSGLALSPHGGRALLPRYRRVPFARHHRQSSHSDATLREGGSLPGRAAHAWLVHLPGRGLPDVRGVVRFCASSKCVSSRQRFGRLVFRVGYPVPRFGLAGRSCRRRRARSAGRPQRSASAGRRVARTPSHRRRTTERGVSLHLNMGHASSQRITRPR
jgi:hypothetical protein